LKFIKTFVLSLLAVLIFCAGRLQAQKKSYRELIEQYQQNYINYHEVVKPPDRKYIRFYPINEAYRVTAHFQRIVDYKGFDMVTADGAHQKYYKYGLLTFTINGAKAHLYIYQSDDLLHQAKFQDYLFVPFGDATSGYDSYGGGRYLDFRIGEIKDGTLLMDFNKAYNPYCAYSEGYECPLPPRENILSIPIKAGEMKFAKPLHAN
jgi:uncharacterized protein